MKTRSKRKKSERTQKHPTPETEDQAAGIARTLEKRAPFRRHELIDVGIIFSLALILRLIFFFLNKQNNPLFHYPIMDSLFHHEWAEEILSGNFLGDEVFFRAPLYPYLLALFYKISGSSITFAVFCQHLLGAGTATFVYLLSREIFSRKVALLAGLLAAFYWPFLYFEGELLIVSLILFLNTVFLWCLSIALRWSSNKLFFLAGTILGLSALARPSILIFLPVLPFALHYGSTRVKTRDSKQHWKRKMALVLAGSAVLILPVMVRNYIVGRDIVPIASQAGVNFYIGNNPDSDGRTAIVPGTRPDWWGGYNDAIDRAEKAEGRKLKPSQVSNYYFKEGFRFISTSPEAAIKLFFRKLYLFWAGGERSNNKYIYFFWSLSGMSKVPFPGFWFITPLALLGFYLQWRRRKLLAPFYLFVASYMLGVVVFFVNARFRLPVVPVLIVFAAYAIFYYIHALRLRSLVKVKLTLILFLFIFVVDYDFIIFRENKTHEDSISHYSLGNAFMKMGNKNRALTEYEKARDTNRRYPRKSYALIARNVDYNLGMLYWENGQCSRAIESLERVGGTDTYALLALELLADCYMQKGRYTDAIRIYEELVIVQRDNQHARLGLAKAHRMAGNFTRCEEILRAQLRAPDFPSGEVHFELGVTLERRWDVGGAIEHYKAAAEDPAVRFKAYLNLARIHRRLGRNVEALEYYSKAQTLQPNDPEVKAALKALRGTP